MKKLFITLAVLCAFVSAEALAWSGIDPETGKKVTISTKRRFVKKNAKIEIFDWTDLAYHEVDVERITTEGNKLKFIVYDRDTGKDRVLLMDDTVKQKTMKHTD